MAVTWLKRILKATGFLLAFTIVALLGLGLDRTIRVAATLPAWDGALSLAETGFTPQAPVQILRDGRGVPHIYGDTDRDVLFGLGFAHAQDRYWQMDLRRRIVRGEMAALFGARALPLDAFSRQFAFAQRTAAEFAALPQRLKDDLRAYTDGVNAALAQHGAGIAPEYVLTFSDPAPWRPEDSLAMLTWMAIGLSENGFRELARLRLQRLMGAEKAAFLMPPYAQEPVISLPELTELSGLGLSGYGASNAWVIAGSRTATGAPLLANDPHLAFSAPSGWYLVHLALADGPLVGASLPGLPTVLLGRNAHMAWGMTNVGADVQDFLVLTRLPSSEGKPGDLIEVQGPNGPVAITQETVQVPVRFGDPQEITLRRYGDLPVMPDSFARARGLDPERELLALRWQLLEGAGDTALAALDAPRASTTQGFVDALSQFQGPMQNVFYAHRSGEIGFVSFAAVPVRPDNHPTGGRFPAPGDAAAATWIGTVPRRGMPVLSDPADGLITNANNRTVPEDWPFYLTSEWAPGYRARRIEAVLEGVGVSQPPATLEQSVALMTDNMSLFARDLLPAVLALTAGAEPEAQSGAQSEPQSEAAAWALDRLQQWDGHMSASEVAPLLFQAWMRAFTKAVLLDDVQGQLARTRLIAPLFLERVVAEGTPEAALCDDLKTDEIENCGSQLRASLDQALEDLEALFGSDRNEWRWGAAHSARHAHLPFGDVPVFKRFFDLTGETGGGPYSPNQGAVRWGAAEPFQNVHGAGYRAVYDLADLDRSLFMITTGQSGNPFSPYYKNFLEPWTEAEMITLPTDKETVAQSARFELMLTP